MPEDTKCLCPKCSTETFSKDSTVYMIVTYNPTLPYVNEVLEYVCPTCAQRWFLN